MPSLRNAFGRTSLILRIVWITTIVAVAGSASCAPKPSAGAQEVTMPRTAPPFTGSSLTGENIALSQFRGKVVILNFWATWCGPCLAEIPTFIRWQRELGPRGLQVVGISMDDDAAPVRAAYRRYQIDYPVIMGDAHLGRLYGGILGLPVTFLIDRDGRIVREYKGPIETHRVMADVTKLLAAPASQHR